MYIGKYSSLYPESRKRYELGQNINEIGRELGVSSEAVRKGIHKAGGKTFRRARKYFVDGEKERRIKCCYGLTFLEMENIWKSQKGMCLWCRAPLPREVLKCVIDHIGGRETFGQKDKVRGLCCSNGHCNRLAGLVESGQLLRNSLFFNFINHVRFVLRTNKGIFNG